MNEMNSLEARLRSWKPRPPSRIVKARIFSVPTSAFSDPGECSWGLALSRLAPAAAAVILLFGSLRGRVLPTSDLTQADGDRAFASLALSSFSAACSYSSPETYEHNSVPAVIFASTNRGRSPSSVGSFFKYGTNSLLH